MGDDRIYSVNEVIADLDQLHGQTIRIGCILNLEFEGNCIGHVPRSERQPGSDLRYGSTLWANFSPELLGLTPDQMTYANIKVSLTRFQRFESRHAIVTATVDRNDRGHMGFWPGSVVIRDIAQWKAS